MIRSAADGGGVGNEGSYVMHVENWTKERQHIVYETWKRNFVIEGDDLLSEYLDGKNFEGDKMFEVQNIQKYKPSTLKRKPMI